MTNVFISYRRTDSDIAAHLIFDILEESFPNEVFIDIDRIPKAVDFEEYLREVLSNCAVLLCLVGPNWLNVCDPAGRRRLDDPGDWVRMEIESGLANQIISVLPVLLSGAAMPKASDLPQALQSLAKLQAVELPAKGFVPAAKLLIPEVSRLRENSIILRQRFSIVADTASHEEIDWTTAAPEQAYLEAQRRVADARKNGANILDLGWLQTLTNLPPEIGILSEVRDLRLGDMAVTDLGPITRLTALKKLTICRLPVENLSPLAELIGLEYLFLTQLPVSDITPLAQLSNLETLSFQWGIQVSDISPLANLRTLRVLSLEDCRLIDNFCPLSKLVHLNRLFLANTRISDVSPIKSLERLQLLDLGNTEISDLSPISELTALESLDISETRVREVTALSGLTALTSLSLNNTQVSDIGPLVRLTALCSLDLNSTEVSDLGATAEFINMIDQWCPTDDPYGVEEGYDGENPLDGHDFEDERGGLYYEGTPIAGRQPFCWLVNLHTRRRTIETINVVRAEKGLPVHYLRGYEGLQQAVAAKDYAEAARLQAARAQATEKDEVAKNGRAGPRTASELLQASWYQLLAKQFQAAQVSSGRAMGLQPDAVIYAINYAHALMFLGHEQEARTLYLEYTGQQIDDGRCIWEEEILNDFTELEQIGLKHPLIDEIRAEFASIKSN